MHASQINSCKKQLPEALAEVFNGRQALQEARHESEKERLYQKIAKLKVEVDWSS